MAKQPKKKTHTGENITKPYLLLNYFEKIPTELNYEFISFLKSKSFEEVEQPNIDNKKLIMFYNEFLISNLKDLSNPSKTRGFLLTQTQYTDIEINWLKSLLNLIKNYFRSEPELELDNYSIISKIIEKLIDEFEIREENRLEREKVLEYEMPIDMDDNYYTIKLSDVQRGTTVRVTKDPVAFRHGYFRELSSRLSDSLSSAEIIPFLKHQLKYVNDKLRWLRVVHHSMNTGTRNRNPHPKSNDSLLMELIPKLIEEELREQEGINQKDEGSMGEIKLNNEISFNNGSEKIETSLSVPQLALLFKIFEKSGIVTSFYNVNYPYKDKNKTALSKLVTSEFSTVGAKNMSELNFKNAYSNPSPETFDKLSKILSQLQSAHNQLYMDFTS